MVGKNHWCLEENNGKTESMKDDTVYHMKMELPWTIRITSKKVLRRKNAHIIEKSSVVDDTGS